MKIKWILAILPLFFLACNSKNRMAKSGEDHLKSAQNELIKPTAPAHETFDPLSTKENVPLKEIEGVGPVNIAESNFYYQGELQIRNDIPTFYDCLTARTLIISKDHGVYEQLKQAYQDQSITAYPKIMATLRGYLTSDFLIVTAIDKLQKNNYCHDDLNIVGSWVSSLVGMEKGSVTIDMSGNYTFQAKINVSGSISFIRGSWQMTDASELALFYNQNTTHLGHQATLHINYFEMFIKTEEGTLIFKKQ